jgi:hypothetical protein
LRDVGEARHIWKEAVVEWAKAARRDTQPSTLNRYLVSLGQMNGIVDGLYIGQITARITPKETEASKAGASAARRADDKPEKERQVKGELASCEADDRPVEDLFGCSDLCSLALPIRSLPLGAPDWEEPAADMWGVIAGLADPDDTATNGRLERKTRTTLEPMRQTDRDA